MTDLARISAREESLRISATEPPGANTVWTSEGTSRHFYKFEGLSSDKRYWFRVVAIGRNGEQIFSSVISRVIQ